MGVNNINPSSSYTIKPQHKLPVQPGERKNQVLKPESDGVNQNSEISSLLENLPNFWYLKFYHL